MMIVCIILFAPMMASTEHSLMQRVQPMQISSTMKACSGTFSSCSEVSAVTPSFLASASITALPPGGHRVTGASPFASAAAYWLQPT